jgi:opine dehydrogenase
MATERVTVLGAGNTGLSLAANLALVGHQVMLWEHPAHAPAIEPIRETSTIRLEGSARTGTARLAGVTVDAAEAMEWSPTVLISVPAYAHRPFLEELTRHVRPDQVIVLLPGNLGSFVFDQAIRDAGIEGVTIAEADTAPYVCRRTGPTGAVIWGEVPHLGIGVVPAAATDETVDALRTFFPGATAYPSALAAGLSALNPIVHPPGVLLNAGRIERSRGEFWFYDEGVTPAVVAAIEALDRERQALGAAFGIDLTPVAEGFHRAGFGPAGDLWAVINGSRMLTALRAPGAIATRWLTEDVPYGLATWAALAAQVGVPTPVMDAIVTLASAVLGEDCRGMGRTPGDLGFGGLTASEIAQWVLGNGGEGS